MCNVCKISDLLVDFLLNISVPDVKYIVPYLFSSKQWQKRLLLIAMCLLYDTNVSFSGRWKTRSVLRFPKLVDICQDLVNRTDK